MNALKTSITNWVRSEKVILVSVNPNGSLGEVLATHKDNEITLSGMIKFDNNTGILLPSDISDEVDKSEEDKGEEKLEIVVEEVPIDLSNVDDKNPSPPSPENEDIEMTFTISAKKLNSIAMAMSMNFDEATAKIEFKGKARKGTSSNPISALKDAINSAGGDIED
jgi:hypothetical protein